MFNQTKYISLTYGNHKGIGGVVNMSGTGGYGYGNSFALIVVLFILLIIVGTSYVGGYY